MIVFFFTGFTGVATASWHHLDFDTAMQSEQYKLAFRLTKNLVGIDGKELFNFCKKLYEKNNLSVIRPGPELKIPLIIHIVWLGSPVPELFKEYIESWQRYNPDWQHMLWTDETVKTLKLYNQHYYDSTDNYGVKSDLVKWEVVYQFGGLYVDVDFECLRSLDELHYTYDFYTGLQPLDTHMVQLGAALFAARPGHPLLKHCITTIKDDWHKKGAPSKTGPIHFTRSFYACAGKDNALDIALPAFYFYPLGARQTELKKEEWAASGAYAVHHWAKSWMPASYRRKPFKKLDNEYLVGNWNE